MTIPMFDAPEPAPLQRAEEPTGKRSSSKKVDSKPRWSAYSAKHPAKCDDCLRVLAMAGGNAPVSRQARWKRVHQGRDLLLCHGHMTQRRQDDGLDPLAAQAPGALR